MSETEPDFPSDPGAWDSALVCPCHWLKQTGCYKERVLGLVPSDGSVTPGPGLVSLLLPRSMDYCSQ